MLAAETGGTVAALVLSHRLLLGHPYQQRRASGFGYLPRQFLCHAVIRAVTLLYITPQLQLSRSFILACFKTAAYFCMCLSPSCIRGYITSARGGINLSNTCTYQRIDLVRGRGTCCACCCFCWLAAKRQAFDISRMQALRQLTVPAAVVCKASMYQMLAARFKSTNATQLQLP